HYFLFPHFAHRHHRRRSHRDSRNHEHQQRKLCHTAQQAFSDRLSFQSSAFQISKPPDRPERAERDARVLVRVVQDGELSQQFIRIPCPEELRTFLLPADINERFEFVEIGKHLARRGVTLITLLSK